MKFIRFGAISASTNYPKDSGSSSFHTPPKEKGIFAFIHPYIEPFLFAWKLKAKPDETDEEYKKRYKQWYRREKRIFEYDGPLWSHFETKGIKIGSWYLTDTHDLPELLQKNKHLNAIHCLQRLLSGGLTPGGDFDFHKEIVKIKDPYKRGLGGFVSKDSLEVFIENKCIKMIH